MWREERLSSFYNLCHNTASLGPIVPSGINQSTVSFQLAASTLAPGTHLLPVPLRFPLPAGQLSPCLGENRAVISPENYRSSDQMLLQRPAGICHSNSRGQDLYQPQTCREIDGKVFSSHTGKMAKKLSTEQRHLAIWPSLNPAPPQAGAE